MSNFHIKYTFLGEDNIKNNKLGNLIKIEYI